MRRYIDIDKLSTHKFTTQEASHNDMGGAYRQGWNDAIDAVVDNESAADVVPMDYHERCMADVVEVGKWHEMKDYILEMQAGEKGNTEFFRIIKLDDELK